MSSIGHKILAIIDARHRTILAALLALAAVLLSFHSLGAPAEAWGPDGEKYEQRGWEAAQAEDGVFACGNFARGYWSPGWIATVAFVYEATGRHPQAVRVLLVALALATTVLVYCMALPLAGARAALAAVALFPFSTLLFRYTTYYQYEVLLAFLVTAAGFLVMRDRDTRSRAVARGAVLRFATAGLALGWAALVSPRVLAFLPVLAWLVWRRDGTRRALPALAAGVVGLAIVLVPWTARNLRCFDEPIVTTTNGGMNLYIGNNAHATGGYHMPAPDERPAHKFTDSAAWRREALDYMAAHPGQTAARMAGKALDFWNPHFGDQFLVALLLVAGWVRLVRWKERPASAARSWVVVAPFVMMAVHMVFFVQPRYMIPVLPFVCVVAGAGAFGWRPER